MAPEAAPNDETAPLFVYERAMTAIDGGGVLMRRRQRTGPIAGKARSYTGSKVEPDFHDAYRHTPNDEKSAGLVGRIRPPGRYPPVHPLESKPCLAPSAIDNNRRMALRLSALRSALRRLGRFLVTNKLTLDRFCEDWRIKLMCTSGPCPRLGAGGFLKRCWQAWPARTQPLLKLMVLSVPFLVPAPPAKVESLGKACFS